MLSLSLVLAGCTVAGQTCLSQSSETGTTRDLQTAVPDGCRAIRSSSGSVELVCANGRIGYAFAQHVAQYAPNR